MFQERGPKWDTDLRFKYMNFFWRLTWAGVEGSPQIGGKPAGVSGLSEPSTWRQGDSGWAQTGRPGGGLCPPLPVHPCMPPYVAPSCLGPLGERRTPSRTNKPQRRQTGPLPLPRLTTKQTIGGVGGTTRLPPPQHPQKSAWAVAAHNCRDIPLSTPNYPPPPPIQGLGCPGRSENSPRSVASVSICNRQ